MFSVSFIYFWLDFLITRYTGDAALEEQFNRFAKAVLSNDDGMAEQGTKGMG